jgi:hypothetical protein
VITNLLVTVLLTVPTWLLSLIPSVPLPGWLTGTGSDSLVGQIGALTANIGVIDSWVPLSVLFGCMAFLATLVAGTWLVRGLRILASFATGGGGGA